MRHKNPKSVAIDNSVMLRVHKDRIHWLDSAAKKAGFTRSYLGRDLPSRARFMDALLTWVQESKSQGLILKEIAKYGGSDGSPAA